MVLEESIQAAQYDHTGQIEQTGGEDDALIGVGGKVLGQEVDAKPAVVKKGAHISQASVVKNGAKNYQPAVVMLILVQ